MDSIEKSRASAPAGPVADCNIAAVQRQKRVTAIL